MLIGLTTWIQKEITMDRLGVVLIEVEGEQPETSEGEFHNKKSAGVLRIDA